MTRLLTLAVLAVLAAVVLAAEEHPRLFLTPGKVAEIRKQISFNGAYHQAMYAAIKARVEQPDLATGYGGTGYEAGYKAVEAAFLSMIAGGDAAKKYGDIAYAAMMSWKGGSATLGKSMESRCMALTYDWAYPVWTDEQRAAMRKRADGAAAALAALTHSNLGGDRSSNFVGVIRGAELLLRMGICEDVKSARSQELIGELARYFAHFGSLGATQEGPGYTEYPAPFAWGAALATREAGDATLYEAAGKREFWRGLMYSRACGDSKSLMWGVGGGDDYSEGWASQLFAWVPGAEMPYYVWWYDRHHGLLSPPERPHRFDSDRHGSVWALILYPTEVKAKDPTGVYAKAVADSRGYIFFRNRWQNAGDVLVMLSAQVRKDEKGWNQPEQTAIGLLAGGTRYIGGPVKETKATAYSALLVDGKYTYQNATERMGKLLAFEPSATGGYAAVQGGQMYAAMGVSDATRQMVVEYLPDGRAIVATLDRVVSETEHTYTWQANVDAAVETGTEGGCQTFLMKGMGTSYTKGWVATPAGAEVKAGDPLQVNVKAKDAEIMVVMLVGEGDAPTATVKGEGPAATVSVAGKTVGMDAGGKLYCR